MRASYVGVCVTLVSFQLGNGIFDGGVWRVVGLSLYRSMVQPINEGDRGIVNNAETRLVSQLFYGGSHIGNRGELFSAFSF